MPRSVRRRPPAFEMYPDGIAKQDINDNENNIVADKRIGFFSSYTSLLFDVLIDAMSIRHTALVKPRQREFNEDVGKAD